MTLKELIVADVQAVFLNEDQFAETGGATYYPADGGESRTIKLIVDRTQQLRTGEVVQYEDERIMALIERHATRGVSEPQIGDTLVLEGDSDTQKFAWNGTFGPADEAGWWMQFVRPKLTRIGTANRRT